MANNSSSDYLQVRFPSWFKRKLRQSATNRGESMAEYLRVAIEQRQERERSDIENVMTKSKN